jgi:hypothetical protein
MPLDLETCTYTGTCDDGLMNGQEEGIDCGGACKACSVRQPVLQTEFEIEAQPIVAEIFDQIEYSVNVKNIGAADAGDIKVLLDKWAFADVKLESISAGSEKEFTFSINVPGDHSQDAVHARVFYGEMPVESKEIPVSLTVPAYAVKPVYKDGDAYPVVIIDNREKGPRTIEARYWLTKDSRTAYQSTLQANVAEDSVFQQTGARLMAERGTYQLESVFTHSGEVAGTYKASVEIRGDFKAVKTLLYIGIAVGVLLAGFVIYYVFKQH